MGTGANVVCQSLVRNCCYRLREQIQESEPGSRCEVPRDVDRRQLRGDRDPEAAILLSTVLVSSMSGEFAALIR